MDKIYISQIAVGGSTYDIKDAEARELIQGIDTAISGGLHYIGETSTELTDGATTSTLVAASANSLSKTTGFVAGDIVIYGELEFVWNGAKWHEFGSTGSLKGLAFKDEATGSATVTGSNNASAVSFTGTTDANFVTGVDTAAVAPSFTEGAFTPASLGTGFYNAGTAATYSHSDFSGGSLGTATTGTFATEGVTASVAAGSEVLTIGAASTSNAVTAQGEFTPARYGTDNFNGGTPTTIDVTKFNGGSKASDTFNAGSAATFSTAKAITSLGTAMAAAQTWSQSTGSVTVS